MESVVLVPSQLVCGLDVGEEPSSLDATDGTDNRGFRVSHGACYDTIGLLPSVTAMSDDIGDNLECKSPGDG